MTTQTAKPARVGLYARVSTNHQDVQMQLSELRAVAAQRGWDIVQEYADEGISGSSTARPGLDAMINDVRSGKLSMVVVWKMDRLGRSLSHLLQLLDEFNQLGVGFVSLRDAGFDTVDSPSRRLLLGLIAVFCEYERSIILERVKAGVQRAKDQGKHCGRPVLKTDTRPILALKEKGHSIREISEMLNLSRGTVWRRLKEVEDSTKVTHPHQVEAFSAVP